MRTTKAPISLCICAVWSALLFAASFYIQNLKCLASFCRCAGRFESYLVETPKTGFSHDKAHLATLRIITVISHRTRNLWFWKRQADLSRLTTKPTKWPVRPAKTQISLGICPVWSECLLSAWKKLGSLATHWAHNEDSDQTGRMPRLIWVFAGRTVILLVLFCSAPPPVLQMKL